MKLADTLQAQKNSQLHWALSSLSLFLVLATKRGTLNAGDVQPIQNKIDDIEKELEMGRIGLEGELDKLIDDLNATMKQSAGKALHFAPFPQFSYAIDEFQRSGVLDQLDMIERILTEAAHAQVIEWETEEGSFQTILKLFSLIESRKISPIVGMTKLHTEMLKLNEELPKECLLPLPELTAY